jgi:hypothetical protein
MICQPVGQTGWQTDCIVFTQLFRMIVPRISVVWTRSFETEDCGCQSGTSNVRPDTQMARVAGNATTGLQADDIIIIDLDVSGESRLRGKYLG